MTKKNAPEVRLRGFSSEWFSQDFEEFFDSSIPKNTLSRANLTSDPTEVKNIHYGDILIKFPSIVDAASDVDTYIKEARLDQYRGQYLKDGDIIFADAAEDETVGKSIEIRITSNQNVVSGLHTIPCRPKKQIKPFFLGHYLNSNVYHRQLLPLMQGTKVLSISKSSLNKTSLKIPESQDEQEKLGQYFQNVDRLIALHSKRHEKLFNVKTAMLEKMFPKDGADVPEIRFKGFTKPWGLRSLESFCIIGDIDHKMPLSVLEGIPYLMTGDFCGINGLDFENAKKISIRDYEQLSRKIKPEKGDILFARYASVGAVRYVETTLRFLISYSCAIIKVDNTANSRCLFYILQANEAQKKLKLEINTGSQGNIGIDSLKKLNVFIPEEEMEQKKVESYFHNLDDLISLQDQELKKLKNLKKAMLEKMFV